MFGSQIVGWVVMQLDQQKPLPEGHLQLFLVAPGFQRQGIGRMFHTHVLSLLQQRGVTRVQLGGGRSYLWQGVPINLPDAWAFFQACGWQEVERSFDLAREMSGYTTPAGTYERLSPSITIELAIAADADAILAFEGQHFSQWLRHYQRVLRHQGFADVVVAKEYHRRIVGASFVKDPHAAWWDHEIRWLSLLGRETGGVGPLGVAEAARGQGIGLALAARVTELLHERGLKTSYIDWTWLVDWYGQLGYQVWQEYIMSWRTLP